MIYMYDKKTNNFIEEFEDTSAAAASIDSRPARIQEVLDGHKDACKGFGFIYKPGTKKSEELKGKALFSAQRKKFYALTDQLCSWEECTCFMDGEGNKVERKDIEIEEGLVLIARGYTAFPF